MGKPMTRRFALRIVSSGASRGEVSVIVLAVMVVPAAQFDAAKEGLDLKEPVGMAGLKGGYRGVSG
jgi:hypothetical protein